MKAIVEATLYDRGTAGIPEDGMWNGLPYVGVWDGRSAPFNDEHPPRLFGDGLTGGQMAGKIIFDNFTTYLDGCLSIRDVAIMANARICNAWEQAELSLDDGSDLGGAMFAFAKIGNDVEILQGGDCYAVWQKKDGTIGITHNAFLPIEKEIRAKIEELMVETGGNRKEMLRKFYPYLWQSRRFNTNVDTGCILLNGQLRSKMFWQSIFIPASELDFLILLTDGFIPIEAADDEPALANEIVKKYKEGRLISILEWARKLEAKKADRSHETFSEATGLAVEFS